MTNLVCLLFGHRFSEWVQAPDAPCDQMRMCDRDGYTERRTVLHDYDEWQYVAAGDCRQVAVCRRCGHETTQTAHTFGEWQYVSDHSCEVMATCSRCGYEEREQAPHQYQADAYQSYPYQQSGLVEAAHCTRCGALACSVCGGALEPVEMKLDDEPPWGVLRTYKCSTCDAQLYIRTTEW